MPHNLSRRPKSFEKELLEDAKKNILLNYNASFKHAEEKETNQTTLKTRWGRPF